MQPASSPEAPYSLQYRESMGSTMPNPMRSMKTVRKITSTDAFLFIGVKRGGEEPSLALPGLKEKLA
jgi:hypothetical protein